MVLATVGVLSARSWSQSTGDGSSVAAPQITDSGPSRAIDPLAPTTHYVAGEDYARTGFIGHIADFLDDQKQIWTSPSHLRLSDANWLVPLGGITAGLFVTDRQYSASIHESPTTVKH